MAKYSGKEWKGRVERNRGCNVEPSWDFRAEINSNQNQKCLDGLSHRMGIREESVDLKIDQQIIQSQQQRIKTKQSKTKQPPCVGQYPKCLTFLLSKFWCNLKNCSNNDQKLPKFGKRHELSDSRSLTNPKQDKQKEIHT